MTPTHLFMREKTMGEWISLEDRMPKLREHIVLMTTNRYWAMEPDSGTPHVTACGYLDADPNHLYWGIYGERSMPLDSFTHWMPLPEPPKQEKGNE